MNGKPGPPKGSQNHLTHGVYALENKRKHGKPDRRTKPFVAMRMIERRIATNLAEARKRWHRRKAARFEYYADKVDDHLATLKHVVRKGRVNPALDLLLRLSDAVDRDYEALEKVSESEKPLDLARKLQLEKQQQSGGK